jgi:phosphate transport system permease protein
MNNNLANSESFFDTSFTKKRLKKRYFSQNIFKFCCISSIVISIIFLLILLSSIITKAIPAFVTYEIKLDVQNNDNTAANILKGNFKDFNNINEIIYLISPNDLEEKLAKKNKETWIKSSSDLDMYLKGNSKKNFSEGQIKWVDYIKENSLIRQAFNKSLFFNKNSSKGEDAGILTSLIGSCFIIIVCIAAIFPIAILTAVYLEEFAPKTKLTNLIELNINNLAAVPSVVFGLIGLAIYIGLFNIPRSSALVGGLTLALMVLPTMVITTRQALKSVPKSIREGALALGASKIQAIIHQVLPPAIPGIMTGVILSIARAIGETAPLIMIGMVAFIIDLPISILEPASALPVQILLWFDNPEYVFIEKTAAAILILLVIMAVMNLVAVFIRNKYEYRW